MMRLERISGYAILTMMAVAIVIPLLSIFLASVQPPGSLLSGLTWPTEWHWENYREAWSVAGFSTLLRSSALVAVGVVQMTLVLATLAGYALGVLHLPGARTVLTVFVSGLVVPVELIIIPLFFNLREIGLTDSYLGVILVEIGLFMPFGVFWMHTFFATVPRDLVDAARVDGASPSQVLRSVLLPLARPSLSTLGVLVFMWSWNQFLVILVLIQQASRRTAPAGLGFFVGQYTTDIPMLSAATIIVILPIVLVYLLFQRSFVAGLLGGALKG
jgi:ABC-type glycerol-3-phosphate transport system permease component